MKGLFKWMFAINSNHVIAFFTATTFLATCAYVYWAMRQWEAIDGQLTAMRASIRQTRELIRYTINQTRSAEKSANAAKDAADTAAKTLRNQQAAFEIDQRPYLIEDGPTFNNSVLTPRQGITVNVTIRNIGKTPAIKVLDTVEMITYHSTKKRSDYAIFIKGAFDKLRAKDDKVRKEIRTIKHSLNIGHDVAPQGSFFTTSPTGVVLDSSEISQLLDDGENRGSVSFYFVGILTYTDAFSRMYKTEFCWFYFGSNIKTWHICDSNNLIR